MANLVIVVTGGDDGRPGIHMVWDESEPVKAIVKCGPPAAVLLNGGDGDVPELSQDKDIQDLTDMIAEWILDSDDLPMSGETFATLENQMETVEDSDAVLIPKHRADAPVIFVYARFPDSE